MMELYFGSVLQNVKKITWFSKETQENSNGPINTLKAELNKRSKLSEQTLFIVKPDGVRRKLVGEIISRFEKKGVTILKLKMFTFTKELATEFYSVHKDKPFFGELLEYITSGPVVVTVVEGNNAVTTTRQMVGATKSFEAEPGSIRGDFGLGFTENINMHLIQLKALIRK